MDNLLPVAMVTLQIFPFGLMTLVSSYTFSQNQGVSFSIKVV